MSMKLIKRIKTYLEIRSRKAREREMRDRIKEEINSLNVFRIDGIDVIMYDGLPVSRGIDDDILDRLAEYRTHIAEIIRKEYE